MHLQVVLLLQVVGPTLELLPQLSLPLVVLRLERKGVVLLAQLLLLEGYVERPDVGLESPLLDAMLVLQLLEGDLHIFSEFTLLVLVDEEDMLDFLLVEVESHDVILLEVLDLPLLVDELALPVLHFFLADDPVVVDALPLLLEVRKQLLLLLVGLFKLAELLAHGKFELL